MRLKNERITFIDTDTGIACITGTFFQNRDFGTGFYGSRDRSAGDLLLHVQLQIDFYFRGRTQIGFTFFLRN
jgi:hypothetical protein